MGPGMSKDNISSQPNQALQPHRWSVSDQSYEEAMFRRHMDNFYMEESQKADTHTLPTVAAGAVPPSLPPSVEEAYRKKCIELKRRMTEVEESNDGYRLRKARLQRGIRKMRLERAYLLEILGKRMKKNGGSVDGYQGIYDEDSEGSSEAPPTPNEKPLRSKRSHRRPAGSPPMAHPQHRILAPSQSHPHPTFEPPRDRFHELQYQQIPTTNGHHPIQFQPHPAALPSQPISPSGMPLRRGPAPPPNAFDEFLMKHVLPNRDQFRYRTEEQGVQMGREAWQDPQFEQIRNICEQNYERNLRAYNEELHEFEKAFEREAFFHQRGGEMSVERQKEGQRELPQPSPPGERGGNGGGGGGGGGFTSING